VEQHSIGEHKISVTIHRKTKGDLLVSQWSLERFFECEEDLIASLRILVSDLVVPINHVPDPREGHGVWAGDDRRTVGA